MNYPIAPNWYTHSMNKGTEHKKTTATTKYPRWVYFVGAAVLICFLLAFVPGGQAMPILGFYIAGWAFSIWLFRKYKWVRILVTIGFILIAFGIYFAYSAEQAGRLFYGN